jgi:hypothetical protein
VLPLALQGAERALYDETIAAMPATTVFGPNPAANRMVQSAVHSAEQVVGDYLGRNGIRKKGLPIPVYVESLEAGDEGVVGAYIKGDGSRIGVNEHIVPGTNLFYKFGRYLQNSNSRFGQYLYNKMMSNPYYNLLKTIVHEKLHQYTQIDLKPEAAKDRDENLIDHLYLATKEALSEMIDAGKLPKYIRPFTGLLANKAIIPMIEGLNDGMTDQVMKGLQTNYQIKERARKDPSTYARFKERSSDALDASGLASPTHLVQSYTFADSLKEAYSTVKKYARNFLETTFARPAYAYSSA